MSTFTRLEIDDGSMSMWMILRSLGDEVLRVADHAVVEARADGEQHVAVLHRHVGFVGAVHAQHAEELRVARRDSAPRPISVLVHGKPSRSTSCASARRDALPRITPPPV